MAGGRSTLPPRAVVVTFDDGSADNVAHAFPILERQRIPAVTFVVTGKLGGRNDWDGDAAPWALMDGAAIRDWARRGFEFGVHGRTHRSLSGLDDAVAETDGAQADLAVLLGKTPLAFAYPYGDVTARARAGRRRFAIAYGVQGGTNRSAADPWMLRRTAVLPAYPGVESSAGCGWVGGRETARAARRRLLHRTLANDAHCREAG